MNPTTPTTPSHPSNLPGYTIVRPDGFLSSGVEYWAEAPKPEMEKPAEEAGKDSPSMGGGGSLSAIARGSLVVRS